ncbi:MAG: hypothetical protein QM758_27125 [Armatimonas sp.]
MTEASKELHTLARRLVAAHSQLPELQGALLSGSAALGISDFYSDIDLIFYYGDTLPTTFPLVEPHPPVWQIGEADSGAVMMAHHIDGVECQLVHIRTDALEAQLRAIMEDLDVSSPTQKALSGILDGRSLYGDVFLANLKARVAAYPDALGRKMIETHLNFFPLWNAEGWREARDAALWEAEIRYEACKNILAVLCGLNRVYFTPFQLKHTRRLCGKLALSPENLAARLEAVLAGDLSAMRLLIRETVALVETHRPEISTEAVRRRIARTWEPWAE